MYRNCTSGIALDLKALTISPLRASAYSLVALKWSAWILLLHRDLRSSQASIYTTGITSQAVIHFKSLVVKKNMAKRRGRERHSHNYFDFIGYMSETTNRGSPSCIIDSQSERVLC